MKIQKEKLEQFKIDWERITAAQEAIYGLDDLNIIRDHFERSNVECRIESLQQNIELLYNLYIKILKDYYGEDIIIQAALDKLEEHAE